MGPCHVIRPSFPPRNPTPLRAGQQSALSWVSATRTLLWTRRSAVLHSAAAPAGRLQSPKLLFLMNPGSNAPSVPRLSPFSLVQPLFLAHIPRASPTPPSCSPSQHQERSAEANATAL